MATVSFDGAGVGVSLLLVEIAELYRYLAFPLVKVDARFATHRDTLRMEAVGSGL